MAGPYPGRPAPVKGGSVCPRVFGSWLVCFR